jgi:hypothetical protein
MSSFVSLSQFSRTRAWSASARSRLGSSRYATSRMPLSPSKRLACVRTGGSSRSGAGFAYRISDARRTIAARSSRVSAIPRRRRTSSPHTTPDAPRYRVVNGRGAVPRAESQSSTGAQKASSSKVWSAPATSARMKERTRPRAMARPSAARMRPAGKAPRPPYPGESATGTGRTRANQSQALAMARSSRTSARHWSWPEGTGARGSRAGRRQRR